ncbi:MAG: TRM11 family methyltransferase [Candidatus Altimarinota bacterium]
MKQYIFIHGKNASLSQYELKCLYEDFMIFQSQAFSLIQLDRDITRKDMNRLGGTIKVCEVIDGDPVDRIESVAKTEKIEFAVSQYGTQGQLSKVLMSIKKDLRERGRNARFLNKDFSNMSSGQLNQSKILEKGIDLVKCYYKLPDQEKGREIWAQTVFFQDIDAYSLRDYEKPKRDMKVGMLPPKLAQMMVNFAKPQSGTTIYDPFCGLGTILLEATLMGFPVAGSDINGRMVEASKENMEWLIQKFDIRPSKFEVFHHDATHTFEHLQLSDPLTIVTEGYLGPPLLRFPNAQEQKKIFDLLHAINSKFFSEISRIIKKGDRIVFCCPFFRSKKEKIFYPEPSLNEYTSQGLARLLPLRSLQYERENQVVGREIILFEKP